MRVGTGKAGTAKRASKKTDNTASAVLATCPTGGGGWCSYPFSAKQLEKRMKAKARLAEIETLQQTAKQKKASKSE